MTPWRVAAVLDGGPLVLATRCRCGDGVLRLWWEDVGRARWPGVAMYERRTEERR